MTELAARLPVSGVEPLVIRALRLIHSGVPRREAIGAVLADAVLDVETTEVLLRRGLGAAVSAAEESQRRGGQVRVYPQLRPAETVCESGSTSGGATSSPVEDLIESDSAGGGGSSSAAVEPTTGTAVVETLEIENGAGGGSGASVAPIRRSQQVAPGKPSEWSDYFGRYPSLMTTTYVNASGETVPLMRFLKVDWLKARDRDTSVHRSSGRRIATEDMAIKMLAERGVDDTRDLPAKDKAVLEAAVKEAWRR